MVDQNCYHSFFYKSLKYLAIITAKNEADNRVDSTVCVRYITGDNYV